MTGQIQHMAGLNNGLSRDFATVRKKSSSTNLPLKQKTKTKQTEEHVAVGQGGRNSPTAS